MKKETVVAGMKILAGLLLHSQHEQTEKVPRASVPSEEKPASSVARAGEQVIAIANDYRGNGFGESISIGEVLTVCGVHADTYTFKERPAEYCPYLGEDAAQHFAIKNFHILDDEGRCIAEFLKSVDVAVCCCSEEMEQKVISFQPVTQLAPAFTLADLDSLLAEYRGLLADFAPDFEAQLDQSGTEGFARLSGSLLTTGDGQVFMPDTIQHLQRIFDKMESYVKSDCSRFFASDIPLHKRLSLRLEKARFASEIRMHVHRCFQAALHNCKLSDEICEQYAACIRANL